MQHRASDEGGNDRRERDDDEERAETWHRQADPVDDLLAYPTLEDRHRLGVRIRTEGEISLGDDLVDAADADVGATRLPVCHRHRAFPASGYDTPGERRRRHRVAILLEIPRSVRELILLALVISGHRRRWFLKRERRAVCEYVFY